MDYFKIITLLLVIVLTILLIFQIKKSKYDFKGFELFIFWILLTFFIYLNPGNDEVCFLPTIFLALYYLLRLIKTKKYINKYILISQVICSIIFIIIYSKYEDNTCSGWCNGTLFVYVISLITFIYMLFINFITFIIKKIKN